MTSDGFGIALRAYTQRRPFKPFLIEFTSGGRIRISHPEAVAPRGQLYYYISGKNRNQVFQSDSVCRFLEIEDEAKLIPNI